jgi:hypothetical protein
LFVFADPNAQASSFAVVRGSTSNISSIHHGSDPVDNADVDTTGNTDLTEQSAMSYLDRLRRLQKQYGKGQQGQDSASTPTTPTTRDSTTFASLQDIQNRLKTNAALASSSTSISTVGQETSGNTSDATVTELRERLNRIRQNISQHTQNS